MTERKPPDASWESFVERQIREAQEAGQFDNLAGFGRPIEDIDERYDELWWVKKKMRREKLSLLPPSLEIRRDVERTWEDVLRMTTETEVRGAVASLNERIRRANFASVTGPPSTTMPLEVEDIVRRWKENSSAG